MLKICPYLQQTRHLTTFFLKIFTTPQKKEPFYRSHLFLFRKENNLPFKIPDHHFIANHHFERQLDYYRKNLITELSPKYMKLNVCMT